MNSMKVSIITVVYNAEKTIEQTIMSVLNQTYSNIEYIVVDGASTDGTLDIINKYNDRISKIISEPDNGIYDAMNKGILSATGEIIGIVNADDWYEINTVENVIDVFSDKKAEIVYGDMNVIESDMVVDCLYPSPLQNMWRELCIFHPATFVRRTVYERLGVFDTTYEIAGDYEFMLRAYSEGVKFQYINSVLSNFRNNGVSCTKLYKAREEDNKISLKYIDKSPNRDEVYIKILDRQEFIRFGELVQGNTEFIRKALFGLFGEDKYPISIIGIGIWGREMSRVLHSCEIEIEGYYDNNPKKNGTRFNNLVVQNPSSLCNKKANVIIAIKKNTEEIEEQLRAYNNSQLKWITMSDLIKRMEDKE